ncbi:PQQ-like domain-containing protein [Paraburkholderia fungorum]|uniref:PQQ-like domain-containing protein n=1 Tax=Paraburkholderia fungorum TaxID=134537 RepID=A0A1H1DWR1_9BURK|nr:PQQ-binding-like beta-propeller repeat protein [Paraburkholderia fungorum]SDQ80678.1 PQQ-like domain-containing protein [Paraburkholderia fungorum]
MWRPRTGTSDPSVATRVCAWLSIALIVSVFVSCGGGGGGSGSGGSAGSSSGSGGGSGASNPTGGSTSGTGTSSTGSGSGGSGTTTGTGSGTGTGSSGSAGGSGGSSTSTIVFATDVLMHHNDLARTGQMLAETALTPTNVNSASFGKVAFLAADGKVDGQPLFVTSLSIGGASHDVVYVVTEHDSVYAYDASTFAQLWKVSLVGSGETPSDDRGCQDITPEIGITSTPVIDRNRGTNGVLYAVAMTKDASGGYHHRLHALDLATGAEVLGGPTEIAATFPGNGAGSVNGVITFNPSLHSVRAALTLVGGTVYMGWTAHCMSGAYNGWLMGYSADTLKQTSVLNVAPNGSQGSVWMAGSGMASDGTSLYVVDGNGTFGTTLNAQGFPVDGDYGNSLMKLSLSNLQVTDYFAMDNVVAEAAADNDFGSGGVMLLPDQTTANGVVKHLAVAAGKDNLIYVVDRDSMGKFNPTTNNIWQELIGTLAGGIWGSPAYYGGVVYYGGLNDNLKALPVTGALLATTAASKSPTTFAYPGATPAVSANGASNAIVWAAENGTTGALHAYDASNLARELYNSNQAGTRDQWGAGNKFITPMIARGKVYVGATNGVAVFGLL